MGSAPMRADYNTTSVLTTLLYGRNLWELAVEHFGAGHKECV